MPDDHELAADLATRAGDLLLALRQRVSDRNERRWQGDRRAHLFLIEELATLRPDDDVLSEEAEVERGTARVASGRTWIVDPLDGTREFGEGRDDWAVHVALAEHGELIAGAVALPARGITLGTPQVAAAAPAHALPARPRVIVSRSRPPALALRVAAALEAELVEMGSAGAKAMAVVLGDADVYLHAGGQYEWDSAAPVAVARAAGLHTSRIDGSHLVYDRPEPYLPDLLICRPPLAAAVLETVAGAF